MLDATTVKRKRDGPPAAAVQRLRSRPAASFRARASARLLATSALRFAASLHVHAAMTFAIASPSWRWPFIEVLRTAVDRTWRRKTRAASRKHAHHRPRRPSRTQPPVRGRSLHRRERKAPDELAEAVAIPRASRAAERSSRRLLHGPEQRGTADADLTDVTTISRSAIVRAEQDDHPVERCMQLEGASIERPSRCGSIQESVATVRPAETFLDDAITGAECGLEHAGPTALEGNRLPSTGLYPQVIESRHVEDGLPSPGRSASRRVLLRLAAPAPACRRASP